MWKGNDVLYLTMVLKFFSNWPCQNETKKRLLQVSASWIHFLKETGKSNHFKINNAELAANGFEFFLIVHSLSNSSFRVRLCLGENHSINFPHAFCRSVWKKISTSWQYSPALSFSNENWSSGLSQYSARRTNIEYFATL